MPVAVALVEALVTELGLPKSDLLLFGDGSGSRAQSPCGWACTSYNRRSGLVTQHFGGASHGTNNYAELSPYLHALWYYDVLTFGQGQPRTGVRVSIVSDSEITVKCGNKLYARRANGALWASMEWYEKNGYEPTWKWVARNTNTCNAEADRLAGELRAAMVAAATKMLLPPERP